jgi:hypothetical protein
MKLAALLGKTLKSDDILEVLEGYQIEEVIYDFDRLHENDLDRYWAAARSSGFQLGFDQDQVLEVVFCYIVAAEGFSPIAVDMIGAPVFATFDEAELFCKTYGLSHSHSKNVEEAERRWLRIEEADSSKHYEFRDGRLSLLTLMTRKNDAG